MEENERLVGNLYRIPFYKVAGYKAAGWGYWA